MKLYLNLGKDLYFKHNFLKHSGLRVSPNEVFGDGGSTNTLLAKFTRARQFYRFTTMGV